MIWEGWEWQTKHLTSRREEEAVFTVTRRSQLTLSKPVNDILWGAATLSIIRASASVIQETGSLKPLFLKPARNKSAEIMITASFTHVYTQGRIILRGSGFQKHISLVQHRSVRMKIKLCSSSTYSNALSLSWLRGVMSHVSTCPRLLSSHPPSFGIRLNRFQKKIPRTRTANRWRWMWHFTLLLLHLSQDNVRATGESLGRKTAWYYPTSFVMTL